MLSPPNGYWISHLGCTKRVYDATNKKHNQLSPQSRGDAH